MWGLEQANDQDMDALGAWAITTGDPDILVAIFDDGLDQDHPDVNQIQGFNFTGSGNDGDHEDECDGHGTCVASCVSGILNNGLGSMGIAPSTRTVGMRYQLGQLLRLLGFLDRRIPGPVSIRSRLSRQDHQLELCGGAASSVVNARSTPREQPGPAGALPARWMTNITASPATVPFGGIRPVIQRQSRLLQHEW